MSFGTSNGPLTAADWSLKNSLYVMVAIRSELLVWDVSNTSVPVMRKTMQEAGIRYAKFANTNESLIAVAGQPNYSLRVHYNNHFQIILLFFYYSVSFFRYSKLDHHKHFCQRQKSRLVACLGILGLASW